LRRAGRHYRRGGRGHPEPGDLVRAAHLVPRDHAGRRLRLRLRHAGPGERQPVGAGVVACRDRRCLPLQGRDDAGPWRLLGRRDLALSGGSPSAMNRLIALLVLMIGGALMTTIAHAQRATTQVNIAGMQPGVAPTDFAFALTGKGPISAWKVVADPT